MPSPNNQNPIALLIRDTPWCTPIESEPSFLPASIAPGCEVAVPGCLRTFIQGEAPGRASGFKFFQKENLSLTASFHKRLHHYLPSFCANRSIPISYPLELSAPRYLATVQKGDKVRIEWTVKNVSCKVQGFEARYAATSLSGASEVFELPRVEVQDAAFQEALDMVPDIQPGGELIIEQEFVARKTAPEYSDAKLQLQLFLAGPAKATGTPACSIMTHKIPIQIVDTYAHNPASQYLLVVNSKTPSWAIQQIKVFIGNELHLGLDIYNISLTGSLSDPASGNTVLHNYCGKSIIIYGNAFPYFDKGSTNTWHFIDSQVANSLARGGTNFLFCAVSDAESLKQWRVRMTYPVGVSGETVSIAKSIGDIVQDNVSRTNDAGADTVVYDFVPRLSYCDKLRARLQKSVSPDTYAQRAADEFTELAPLQRFMVFPAEHSVDGDHIMLTAMEGLPKTANMVSSTLVPEEKKSGSLCAHLQYGIINALPFPQLARMFWGSFFAMHPRTDKEYASDGKSATVPTGTISLLFRFICLAIESQVANELTHLLESKVAAKDCPTQANKLNFLLDVPILLDMPKGSMPDPTHIRTIGTILGTLLNIGFTEFFSTIVFSASTKHKLHSCAVNKLERALHIIAAEPETVRQVLKGVEERAMETKKHIKALGNIAKIMAIRKESLHMNYLKFMDLAAISSRSLAVTRAQLEQMRLDDRSRVAGREADEKHASTVLARHVNMAAESSSKDWNNRVEHAEKERIDCAEDTKL